MTPAVALLTTLLGSAMLFVVQPLATKMVLPELGGASATWAVAALFFQCVLLGGYVYALALRRLPSRAWELGTHGLLAAIALVTLPFTMQSAAAFPEAPTRTLLLLLSTQLALPLLVVSATSPLLQTWWRDAARPTASRAHPSFLLAIGSVGSISSVVLYVGYLEPMFDSQQLAEWWRTGVLVLALLVIGCGVLLRPGRDAVRRDEALPTTPVPWALVVRWTALAAFATAMLLATTNHLSHDIAAVPLLWVAPLVAFLIAYAVAFSMFAARLRRPARWAQLALTPMALLALAVSFRVSLELVILLHLGACTAAVLVAVGRLSETRGDARHVGAFNIALAGGGVLGGVLVAVLAPVLLPSLIEYPALLTAGLLIGRDRRAVRTWIPIAVCVACWFDTSRMATRTGQRLFSERNFFGAYEVRRVGSGHVLHHGTTMHGRQDRRDSLQGMAAGYYHAEGPLGQLLGRLRVMSAQPARVLVVGLGAGAIACAVRPSDDVTFLEIDPLVVHIARDSTLFSYLARCAPNARITLGDARLTARAMRAAGAARFDVIILDAFSSDAVPVHLITIDAYREYAALLAESGVIVTHVSNRYLSLQPVVNAAGSALGWHIARGDPAVDAGHARAPAFDPSHWVALTPSAAIHDAILSAPGWTLVTAGSRQVRWTDRRSSILEVLARR